MDFRQEGVIVMLQETEKQDIKQGLLPTPPLPTDISRVELSDNARKVFPEGT